MSAKWQELKIGFCVTEVRNKIMYGYVRKVEAYYIAEGIKFQILSEIAAFLSFRVSSVISSHFRLAVEAQEKWPP
jgi:hypothetical protein